MFDRHDLRGWGSRLRPSCLSARQGEPFMASIAVVAHREKMTKSSAGDLKSALTRAGLADALWCEIDKGSAAEGVTRKTIKQGAKTVLVLRRRRQLRPHRQPRSSEGGIHRVPRRLPYRRFARCRGLDRHRPPRMGFRDGERGTG